DAAKTVESLRLELKRCRGELEMGRLRMGELEQVEALLAGENRLLEMVAKGESLPSILDGICRLVEAISSTSLCSILLLDPKGNCLWLGASPSLPVSYTTALHGRAIGPRTGPCVRAAYARWPTPSLKSYGSRPWSRRRCCMSARASSASGASRSKSFTGTHVSGRRRFIQRIGNG